MKMREPPFDPRAVCNLLLDEADRDDIAVSNLALQKLLYFTHALFLVRHRHQLVAGYFEAWQFGPVHPAAYTAFKSAGEKPIRFRAERIEVLSGHRTPLPLPEYVPARQTVAIVMRSLGRMTPGRLVEIAHAEGAPWRHVVDNASKTMAAGLRIGDALILERFKYHKVSVGLEPAQGVPGEDAPFA